MRRYWVWSAAVPAALALMTLSLLPTSAALGQEEESSGESLATTPAIQDADWAKPWWMPRHEEKLKEKADAEQVDLVWIGDSITHGWEGGGKAIWEQRYAPRHSLNLGFSGDRTENVLWRLQHGAIDDIAPKAFVIMIGTNNTGHRQDPAEETAEGIKLIVDELRTRYPDAQVLLLAIFPRGETTEDPLRVLNEQINSRIEKLAADDHVHYLNINDKFLNEDGTLPKDIMPDLLHPNEKGYQIWSDAIEETLAGLLD
ncbi:MAG: platelet-activating factor acetylhydrolase IB subunit [Pirellulaceae bacterium]|nr:GDSL family lipase [Planctomycetales bacterium]